MIPQRISVVQTEQHEFTPHSVQNHVEWKGSALFRGTAGEPAIITLPRQIQLS